MAGRKFGIPSDQRRALLKGLVRALLVFQRIQTTETRAKDVRIIAERLITSARHGDTVHARRQVNRTLNDETLTRHVFTKIAPAFKDAPGGYTRLTKIGQRRGDAAPIVMLELATDQELGTPVLPEKIGTRRTEKTW
jgi:large subunit ribosomal protein L17